jgi:hypothetical protein
MTPSDFSPGNIYNQRFIGETIDAYTVRNDQGLFLFTRFGWFVCDFTTATIYAEKPMPHFPPHLPWSDWQVGPTPITERCTKYKLPNDAQTSFFFR